MLDVLSVKCQQNLRTIKLPVFWSYCTLLYQICPKNSLINKRDGVLFSHSLRCWRERCRFKEKTGKRRWPWSSSKTPYTPLRSPPCSFYLSSLYIREETEREREKVQGESAQGRIFIRGDRVQHSGGRGGWGLDGLRSSQNVLIALHKREKIIMLQSVRIKGNINPSFFLSRSLLTLGIRPGGKLLSRLCRVLSVLPVSHRHVSV